MTLIKHLSSTLLLTLLISFPLLVNHSHPQARPQLLPSTASAARVRFTAPGSIVQIRVEVYSANAQGAFDNEIRGGNVLEWHLQDGQADSLDALTSAS